MRTFFGSFSLGLLSLLLMAPLAIYISYFVTTLPRVEEMKGCLTAKMFSVKLCPGSASYARLDQISPYLKSAVIISEDSSFYSHNGFSFEEIKESILQNFESRRYARGASTVTQQLAKNVFLSQDKTIIRKFKEALLTYQIEQKFTKDQILERYLNVVQYGKSIFGVKAAAQHYFQKHPQELNLLESAYLTLLLPNPEKYSAGFRAQKLTDFVSRRIKDICRKLLATKRITHEEYSAAVSNIGLFPHWSNVPKEQPANEVSPDLENEGEEPDEPLEWE